MPAGVREAIRARLARLSETVRLLQTASVVGRDFTLPVVARMLQASELMCLPLIEEAAPRGWSLDLHRVTTASCTTWSGTRSRPAWPRPNG